MTTIAAVRKCGYVAIAADTMLSAGPMKMTAGYNKTCQKILRVGDSFLGMSGYAVNTQVLGSMFRLAGQVPEFKSTEEIFEVFRVVHARLRDEYYLNPRTDPTDAYESSQMVVLIVNPYGIYGVSPNRTVNEYDPFWAAGSGMEYALGAMHALYDKCDDAQTIAEAAVRAAIDFDTGSAGPIESRTICLAPKVVEDYDLLLQV